MKKIVLFETALEVSKYSFFGPYFLYSDWIRGLNTGKYAPVKSPYLDNFLTVWILKDIKISCKILV